MTLTLALPDEALALSAANGDRGAIAALVARVHGQVLGHAWRLTGNRADAEDLAQDICASLPQRLVHYRPRARFTTWLYRVTVNAAHDLRRRQMARGRAAFGWGEWEVARRAEIAEEEAAMDWLHSAMDSLPAPLRQTLAMAMTEDLPQCEIARRLGLSEGTIAWRLSEARRHLRAMAKGAGTLPSARPQRG